MNEKRPQSGLVVNVLVAAGALKLEVIVPGKESPTIYDVIASYEELDKLEGWTPKGQWMVYYPAGIAAISEDAPSRAVLPIRSPILRSSQ